MTDQSADRLFQTWLESEAPSATPEGLLDRIDTATRSARPRPAWVARLEGHHMDVIEGGRRTGVPRLSLALIIIAALLATVAVVAFIASQEPTIVDACPTTLDEATVIDTSTPGLSQPERAWGIAGGTPGTVRPGQIAAFEGGGTTPLSVIMFDPETGARCTLVRIVADHPLREHHTTSSLDWSPSGDALAIGLEGLSGDGPEFVDTHVLIWTPTKLFRVWSGPAQAPELEWAPDGRSIAVWSAAGESTPVVVLHADGSPDQTFEVSNLDGLKWSPDGTRWVVVEWSEFGPGATSSVAIVDGADGRITPIDLGIAQLRVVGWLDDQRVLLVESEQDVGPVRYLDVPVDAPETYSVIPFPEEVVTGVNLVLSPDRQRMAYSVVESGENGPVAIVDLNEPARAPLHLNLDETGFLAEHAWSPDGSFVLIASWSRVWIVNADGSAPRQVASDVMPLGDAWQPVPVP